MKERPWASRRKNSKLINSKAGFMLLKTAILCLENRTNLRVNAHYRAFPSSALVVDDQLGRRIAHVAAIFGSRFDHVAAFDRNAVLTLRGRLAWARKVRVVPQAEITRNSHGHDALWSAPIACM